MIIDSAEKPCVHPSRNLRTNGAAVEIIGDFSVHAEPGRSIPMFFSRIKLLICTICHPDSLADNRDNIVLILA
jgi:hypothetical protein